MQPDEWPAQLVSRPFNLTKDEAMGERTELGTGELAEVPFFEHLRQENCKVLVAESGSSRLEQVTTRSWTSFYLIR